MRGCFKVISGFTPLNQYFDVKSLKYWFRGNGLIQNIPLYITRIYYLIRKEAYLTGNGGGGEFNKIRTVRFEVSTLYLYFYYLQIYPCWTLAEDILCWDKKCNSLWGYNRFFDRSEKYFKFSHCLKNAIFWVEIIFIRRNISRA